MKGTAPCHEGETPLHILILIIWTISAVMLGLTAQKTGRSFLVWLALGIITSPLVSWLLYLILVKGK